MPRIRWKERRRRTQANLKEAWVNGGFTPEDPGLREVYATIPRAPIRLIVLPLIKAVNHGGLLRLAEAYRLESVDFSPEPDEAVDTSGQRGTMGWQPHRWIPALDAIAEAKALGYAVAALTLGKDAQSLSGARWTFPLALVVGSENEGIPAEVLQACDLTVGIPLYGLVTSINVGMAAALAVQSAVAAYAKANPEFQPVRSVSRRLLGLPVKSYEPDSIQE